MPKIHWSLLGALTVLAFGLRVWGAEQAAPYVPDTQIVRQAMDLGQALASGTSIFDIGLKGDPKYPMVLPYLLLGVYGLVFVAGRLAGTFQSMQEFTGWLFLNRVLIHVVTVYVISIISSLSVPLVFFMAGRFEKRTAPWAAAILVAFSLVLVHFSHHARPHIPVAFFILLSLYFSFRLYETGTWRNYLLAGASAALAAGTLQNGLLAVIPVAVAHFLRVDWRSRKGMPGSLVTRPLIVVVGAFVLVFFAAYPQLITQPAGVVKVSVSQFTGTPRVTLGGQTGINLRAFNVNYINKNMAYLLGYEPIVTVLGLLGLAGFFFVRQARPHHVILASFAIVFSLVFIPLSFALPHYFSPLVGVLAIFAARVVAWVRQFIEPRLAANAPALAGGLGAVCILVVAGYAFRLDVVLSQTDTRSQARDWIVAELTPGVEIAAEFRLEMFPTRESILRQQADLPGTWGTREQWLSQLAAQDYPTPSYAITDLDVYLVKTPLEFRDLLARHKVDYLVFEQYVAQPRFDYVPYNYALRQATRIAVFCPHTPVDVYQYYALPDDISAPWVELWKLDSPGPIVQIFEVTPPKAEQPRVPDC